MKDRKVKEPHEYEKLLITVHIDPLCDRGLDPTKHTRTGTARGTLADFSGPLHSSQGGKLSCC